MQDGPEDAILELINKVAVSVGLVFLFLTILTLAVCQRGTKETNVALINLCISLFLAHLVFLLTQEFLEYIEETQVSIITNLQSPGCTSHFLHPLFN